MRNTKAQLEWQIKVLDLALHMAAFTDKPVRGSQHWLDLATRELINRSVEEGKHQGVNLR